MNTQPTPETDAKLLEPAFSPSEWIEYAKKLERERDQARAVIREAWDVAECGYILDGVKNECGMCGGVAPVHNQDCFQAILERGLNTGWRGVERFELNDQVKEILGFQCFQAGPIAHQLVKLGHTIEGRAEEEQAHVIHWMLHLYFQHGDNWRTEGDKILRGEKQEAELGLGVPGAQASAGARTEGGEA
jgi:hypothetical protein